uniref:Uncharacterized protein n=1 Tax=Rhizophora mucronata TaxID=61149 RepID=A0A2P2NJT1_RHIMU
MRSKGLEFHGHLLPLNLNGILPAWSGTEPENMQQERFSNILGEVNVNTLMEINK